VCSEAQAELTSAAAELSSQAAEVAAAPAATTASPPFGRAHARLLTAAMELAGRATVRTLISYLSLYTPTRQFQPTNK
jgi:hypothetical protein